MFVLEKRLTLSRSQGALKTQHHKRRIVGKKRGRVSEKGDVKARERGNGAGRGGRGRGTWVQQEKRSEGITQARWCAFSLKREKKKNGIT